MNELTLSFPLNEIKTEISANVTANVLKEILPLIKTAAIDSQGSSFLSRKDTAKMLSMSIPTLWSLTKQGKIPAYRIGVNVRYKKSEVEESLKQIRTS